MEENQTSGSDEHEITEADVLQAQLTMTDQRLSLTEESLHMGSEKMVLTMGEVFIVNNTLNENDGSECEPKNILNKVDW